MKPSFEIDFQPLAPKRIEHAKNEELILCDDHVPERLDELQVAFFVVVSDQEDVTCSRCDQPAAVYDLPFYLTDPGDFVRYYAPECILDLLG